MKVRIEIGDAVNAIERSAGALREAFELLGRKIAMPRLNLSEVVENQCMTLRMSGVMRIL